MESLLKSILTDLTSLPHRGSATQGERNAAGKIEKWLADFGYKTRVQPFPTVTSYTWELLVLIACIEAGLIFSLFELYNLGSFFSLLGLWLFYKHFDGHVSFVNRILPKGVSQNILAEKNEIHGKKEVYLMAHYDTTRASLLFHPKLVKNFRSSFVISSILVLATPFTIILGNSFIPEIIYQTLLFVLAFYFFIQAIVLLQREIVQKFVNGANDNGSGVAAVLAMAKYFAENPCKNVTLKIVATGSEESGMNGARAFASRLKENKENIYVLNFDNIGRGTLRYCTGEGMLMFHQYDSTCVAIAENLANSQFPEVAPLRYTRAYFDSLPLIHHNIKTISFIALDDDIIPNWHWYSDTIDNIDWETLKKSVDFGIAFVQELDRKI